MERFVANYFSEPLKAFHLGLQNTAHHLMIRD